MKVYGIKNCNTVAKALKWLDDHQLEYEFHDFKKLGVSNDKLEEWSAKLGWETLLNKKGTTWKKLAAEEQNAIQTKEQAFNLMRDKTSVIKRPIIESDDQLLQGFDETVYKNLLS